jgi:hypothetical protein
MMLYNADNKKATESIYMYDRVKISRQNKILTGDIVVIDKSPENGF